MEAPEELRGLARDGLRKIAARELKARGPRMDAVFYQLDALRLFRGMSLPEIQEITFEIGMLGKYGLDINDPQETHVLRALPGRAINNSAFICLFYNYLINLLKDLSNLLLQDIPKHLIIQAKIPVNRYIPEPGNLPPLDNGIAFSNRRRYMLGCLA